MVGVVGSQLPLWETWIEFWTPGSGLAFGESEPGWAISQINQEEEDLKAGLLSSETTVLDSALWTILVITIPHPTPTGRPYRSTSQRSATRRP